MLGSFLIDVLFRKGSAHSNHGTDYTDRVKAVVKLIIKQYSAEVPIIICADSGFADQKSLTPVKTNIQPTGSTPLERNEKALQVSDIFGVGAEWIQQRAMAQGESSVEPL